MVVGGVGWRPCTPVQQNLSGMVVISKGMFLNIITRCKETTLTKVKSPIFFLFWGSHMLKTGLRAFGLLDCSGAFMYEISCSLAAGILVYFLSVFSEALPIKNPKLSTAVGSWLMLLAEERGRRALIQMVTTWPPVPEPSFQLLPSESRQCVC